MDVGRVLGALSIALLFLAIVGIATYLGVLHRDYIEGLENSLVVNGTGVMVLSLRGTDVGIVAQLCGPTEVRVLSGSGKVISAWNVAKSYWETVVHLTRPGIYAFVVRGCGVLRIIQASGENPRAGLVAHVLDPYERGVLRTAAILGIASSAGFFATMIARILLERLRR